MSEKRSRPGTPMLLAAVAMLAACTTVTYESYRPVANRSVDIAYVAESADFSRYRRLLPEEMGIYYPSHAPASPEDLEAVRATFRAIFLEELAEYELVDRPGPDVLKIRASLVDLRYTSADRLPNLADDLNAILEPGKLTFMIEMRDSVSNNLLLRAADTEKSPRFADAADQDVAMQKVATAARHWAQLFRAFLDTNLSRNAT